MKRKFMVYAYCKHECIITVVKDKESPEESVLAIVKDVFPIIVFADDAEKAKEEAKEIVTRWKLPKFEMIALVPFPTD
jgi:hypothetical protein